MRWEAANGKPSYADLCIQLMDAAYPIVPGALFFVEGTGQADPGYDGLAFNWGRQMTADLAAYQTSLLRLRASAGDGLASTSAAFQQYPGISDAGLFFEQVLSKPYLSQVGCNNRLSSPAHPQA